MNIIDQKIQKLREITSNFLYIEWYSHLSSPCWKIDNQFTKLNKDKLVLCPIDEGIEKALDLAIKHIGQKKSNFNNPYSETHV